VRVVLEDKMRRMGVVSEEKLILAIILFPFKLIQYFNFSLIQNKFLE